jgi:predicted dehydrogenase
VDSFVSAKPLNIAVVGLGFMGATHIKAWQQIPDAHLCAVVSTDPRKLSGDLSSVGGNLSAAAGQFDFSAVRACHSLEEVLSDPAIDVVDICLPTDRHSSAATSALRTGKHVLLEKPMALNAAAADALLREASRSGRILMVAHVLRFFPAYRKLAQLIHCGAPARSALFRRKCAAPAWSP